MGLLDKIFTNENNNDKPSNQAVLETKSESKTSTIMQKKESDVEKPITSTQLESQMSELANEYSKLRASLKISLFSERDILTSDREKTEQSIADLNNRQIQYTNKKNELLAEDDSELENQLAGNKQQLENQNELIEKYQEQNNGVEEELRINADEISKVATSIDSNRQAEDNLSEEIKTETDLKKMYELMENQKKAVANLYDEREKLTAQRDTLLTKKDALTNENQQLLNSINETSENATEIKNQITQLERQIQDNSQQRKQNIAQLTSQLSSVTNELTVQNNHLVKTNKSIKQLDNKIQTTFNSDHLVRDVEFDSTKTYAILQSSTDVEGKQTGAIYDFAVKNSDNKIITLTNQTFNNLSNIDGTVIDLYRDLQYSKTPTSKRVSVQDKPEWKTEKIDGMTKIYDDSDKLLMIVNFDNKIISSIDYYADDQINKTNIYNRDGILSKVKFYNDKESVTEETFYRTDGSTVLTKQFESDLLTSIQLFDDDGLQTKVFSSESDLIKWWFENSTREYKNLVLIGDPTDETFKTLSANSDLKAETLVYLDNVHSNIGRIRALLHSKPIIYDILVNTQDDLQSIEDITDRDINVSVINNTVYDKNSEKLPKALI